MIKHPTTILHIMFFNRSRHRAILEKDIKILVQICDPQRENLPFVENLSWLIIKYKEFRNLFYYRIEKR